MIPWTGDEMHDPPREGGCWGDQGGTDCLPTQDHGPALIRTPVDT